MSAYRLFPLRGGSSLGDNPNSRLSSASAALGQEIELQPVTSSPPQADDNRVLRRLGKNPVLKRNFEFASTLGFSSAVILTWEHYLTSQGVEANISGPAGAFWGYIVVMLGCISTYATLAELASMSPTAGGVYFWVAMLAPVRCQKFLSYTTGWLSALGWQALLAVTIWMNSLTVVSLFEIGNTEPEAFSYRHVSFGLYCMFLASSFAVNLFLSSSLPKIMTMILILHILGFFGVLLPLVILGSSTKGFDFSFLNKYEWPTVGLGWVMFMTQILLPFLGADAAKHLSEEIQNANIVVPRSMMISILLNGLLGLGMATALILMFTDDAIVDNTSFYGVTFPHLFSMAMQSVIGAQVLTSVVVFMCFSSTVGIMASTTRQLWSFSRERGVPGSQWLRRVNSKFSIPVVALVVVTVISFAQATLMNIPNTADQFAGNGAWVVAQAAIMSGYLLVATLLLYRRWKGDIAPYEPSSTTINNVPGTPLMWGPWRIQGFVGSANNVITIVFLLILWFFTFWPGEMPRYTATDASMNWSSAVLVGFLGCTTALYFLWANKYYVGPWVEV